MSGSRCQGERLSLYQATRVVHPGSAARPERAAKNLFPGLLKVQATLATRDDHPHEELLLEVIVDQRALVRERGVYMRTAFATRSNTARIFVPHG